MIFGGVGVTTNGTVEVLCSLLLNFGIFGGVGVTHIQVCHAAFWLLAVVDKFCQTLLAQWCSAATGSLNSHRPVAEISFYCLVTHVVKTIFYCHHTCNRDCFIVLSHL